MPDPNPSPYRSMLAITRNWPLCQYILIAIQVGVWHACRAHKSRRRSYFDMHTKPTLKSPDRLRHHRLRGARVRRKPSLWQTYTPARHMGHHGWQSAHSSICNTQALSKVLRQQTPLSSSIVHCLCGVEPAAAAWWRGAHDATAGCASSPGRCLDYMARQ